MISRNIFDNSCNCTEHDYSYVLTTFCDNGCRTIGLSDYRVVGLSGCRTIGSSDYRAVGISGRRNIRLEPKKGVGRGEFGGNNRKILWTRSMRCSENILNLWRLMERQLTSKRMGGVGKGGGGECLPSIHPTWSTPGLIDFNRIFV